MSQLATPEPDRHLDAIAFLEELDRPMDLCVEVADADLGREADFLERHRPLPTLGFLLLLGQFVLVLTEVEEPRDRRRCHRCYLDEVEAPILRHFESLGCRHDAQLVALFVDHPDLWDPDHLIHAQISADGRSSGVRYTAMADTAGQSPPAAAGLYHEAFEPGNGGRLMPTPKRPSVGPARPGLRGEAGGEVFPAFRRLLLAGAGARRCRPGLDLAIAEHDHVRDLLLLRETDLVLHASVRAVDVHPKPASTHDRGELT